jgi:hypothetical protein
MSQNHFLELSTKESLDKAKWYVELDSFLDDAQSKKILQDRYGLSL